jgi:nucleoside-diphosphate-sugar epimerase
MYVGVTGATGKIGRWLVRELLDNGHKVRAMVRPTRDGFWGNTQGAVQELQNWGVELFQADFGDDDSMKRFAQSIEVLVHNGYHHVNEDEHPVEWTNLNILATIKLYEAMWKAGGKQIIFISSGAVYGRGPAQEEERFGKSTLPFDERTARAPRGLYAVYKSCIEDATVVFKTVHGMKPSSSLRPTGEGFGELFGFRCYDDKGVLADEIRRLVAGEEVVLKLPPQLVCVDGHDLGRGCNLLIQKGVQEKAEIADWYLLGNAPMKTEQLPEMITEIFGKVKVKLEIQATGRGRADSLIHKLGYQPRGTETTMRKQLLEIASRLGVKA